MKYKQKYLSLAIALMVGTISYANYTIIINPDKSSINFTAAQWKTTTPKFIGWVDAEKNDQYYRYECGAWAPLPETVIEGTTFTQTAKNCKSHQYANMINQEMKEGTKEVRDSGVAYIDKTNFKVVENLENTQESKGVKSAYLTIINPVQGQSGIYQVSNGKSGTFPAYVNMTDSGGNWILIARWTSSPSTNVAWNGFGVKGNTMSTYTNSASTYPVVPTGSINSSSQMMVKNANASWTSLYGTWQTFSTFDASTVIGTSGFPVNTSIGAKTMFIRANGWNGVVPQDMTSIVGLFNTYSNKGVCGGANIVGSNKMCITYTNDNASHFDLTNIKEFYIKSLN